MGESISSADLSASFTKDDSSIVDSVFLNEENSEVKHTKEEKKALDPKYSWKDRSRTSEEFELSLEINDKDFLETVKTEYRSSSPSWANQKFKFPVKKEKPEKKLEEKVEEN